ncbi:MAG: hypothetical protein M3Y54_18420 [Bacteroidota bacterium]|nr:hypothetical protein [Bacteroidota bacterium]
MLLLAPAPRLMPCPPVTAPPPLLVARDYQVSYRLKRATLHLGRVKSAFFVFCTRRFPTNELNVILAELYEEVGPAPDLLGIEILAIASRRAAKTSR